MRNPRNYALLCRDVAVLRLPYSGFYRIIISNLVIGEQDALITEILI